MTTTKRKKKAYQCPDCGERFESLDAVLAHILEKHPDVPEHKIVPDEDGN
jgi:uncharacterized Zn-finger protein